MTELQHDGPAVKRPKVRKGTHSCQECRRRKVGCIYAATDSGTCIVCKRRGTQCISQWDSARSINAAVNMVDNDEANARTSPQDDDADAAFCGQASKSRPAALTSPGECLGPKTESSNSDHVERRHSEPQSHGAIRDALIRTLPCTKDIEILSATVSATSVNCYQSDHGYHSSGSYSLPMQHIPLKTLLQPEKHPTLLAMQMLLFASAIQQLPPKQVVPGLTEHQHAIMKRLAKAAIELVNMDDTLIGTLEHIECLIFEFFFHADGGNIRKAWITARRAVTAAQMMGLHRPGHHRFVVIQPECGLRPEIIWRTVVSTERMISLLLGLPISTAHMSLEVKTMADEFDPCQRMSALVGTLAAKILQRNQMDSIQQAFEKTSQIDRDIVMAAEQMPPDFWRPLSFAGVEKDSPKAVAETRRALGHMFYYSMVVQLHLPHMLGPHDVSQRIYSKMACVNAGREILTREIELRTFNPISACCRIGDFLALIAGMAMILGHTISHSGNGCDHLLAHQRLGDRATVERALDCIDPMYEVHGDVFAVSCAALLRDLLAIEADAARKDNLRAGMPDSRRMQRHHVLIMRVPYLGSIRISQDGIAALPTAKIDEQQDQNLSEGVTLGGIGSILVGRPDSSAPGEDDGTLLPVTPTSAICDAQVISTLSPPGADLMYPYVAADFEDCAFQGVDTAFIEALMRGSVVPPQEDLTDEQWDINTFL